MLLNLCFVLRRIFLIPRLHRFSLLTLHRFKILPQFNLLHCRSRLFVFPDTSNCFSIFLLSKETYNRLYHTVCWMVNFEKKEIVQPGKRRERASGFWSSSFVFHRTCLVVFLFLRYLKDSLSYPYNATHTHSFIHQTVARKCPCSWNLVML